MSGYGGLLERLKRLEVGYGELGQAAKLLEAACLASTGDPQHCRLLAGWLRDHALFGTRLDAREAAREVLDRFELRGRCLVERGVGVEDPAVCEGGVDGGQVRITVARVGGECAVAIDRGELDDWALRELKAGRTGLLKHDGAALGGTRAQAPARPRSTPTPPAKGSCSGCRGRSGRWHRFRAPRNG